MNHVAWRAQTRFTAYPCPVIARCIVERIGGDAAFQAARPGTAVLCECVQNLGGLLMFSASKTRISKSSKLQMAWNKRQNRFSSYQNSPVNTCQHLTLSDGH